VVIAVQCISASANVDCFGGGLRTGSGDVSCEELHSMLALSTRMKRSNKAEVEFRSKTEPAAPCSAFKQFKDAFESEDGILVSVGGATGVESPLPQMTQEYWSGQSDLLGDSEPSVENWATSVLQANLPLAFFSPMPPPLDKVIDVSGTVLMPFGTPNAPVVQCSFPLDAATVYRQHWGSTCSRADFTCDGEGPQTWNISGPCKDNGIYTGSDWVDFYIPSFLETCGGIEIQVASCSFDSHRLAMEASMQYVTRLADMLDELPTDSEAQVFPYTEIDVLPWKSNSVLAIFWAHRGPFQDNPKFKCGGICVLKSQYQEVLEDGEFPVFEIAQASNVNGGTFLNSSFGKSVLADFTQSQSDGGINFEDVVRQVSKTTVSDILHHCNCP